ncbi:ABC-type sugar transport system, periplasmic component [human gut metagenome]|uniref:ABC-type sugar transport system, periplasmic component n=1 Tax=human gut metagenome TaxID=408170 RepID=K1TTG7_9ZZZZ
MLSEDAQNRSLRDGQDLLSYSQDVDMQLTEYLKDVKPVIEENHMYIRIASNDFFLCFQGCGFQDDLRRIRCRAGIPVI